MSEEFGTPQYELSVVAGGLELLLAAVHADDPKREILVRVGDLMRDVKKLGTTIQTTSAENARTLQYSEDQLKVGVQYIDWDEKLDIATEIRQLGEAISRMGGPTFDVSLQARLSLVGWRSRSADEPEWQYSKTKLSAKDLARKDLGFEEQPLYAPSTPVGSAQDSPVKEI